MAQVPLDEVNTFLEKFDPYIRNQAQYKVPRNIIPPLFVEDEIDEIAQKTRIKLWEMCRRSPITNPIAYINTIIFTEVVDMVRRYKRTSPLPVNDDGELYENIRVHVLVADPQNPSDVLEQEEGVNEFTLWVSQAILNLPPRQQQALLWSLKARVEDVLPVINILLTHNIDIEKIEIVQEVQEKQRLTVSLSLARKRLRHQYIADHL